MNYEAGTEERKGLTKCLNFKRPETILGAQAVRGLSLRVRIYTRTFFRVYITDEEETAYPTVLSRRPVQ